jgi:3-polyprenyl-4-hydroxybenzoate decarboxylase
VRFYVEHGEVIVDKADERKVDAPVSVVTGSPPHSVRT